jgi:hypothetical protein
MGLFIFRRGDGALFGIFVAQNFDENYDWPKKMNKSLFFGEKIGTCFCKKIRVYIYKFFAQILRSFLSLSYLLKLAFEDKISALLLMEQFVLDIYARQQLSQDCEDINFL